MSGLIVKKRKWCLTRPNQGIHGRAFLVEVRIQEAPYPLPQGIHEEIKIGFPILPGLSRHKHVVAQGHAKKAHANFSNAIISSEPEAIGLSTVSGF